MVQYLHIVSRYVSLLKLANFTVAFVNIYLLLLMYLYLVQAAEHNCGLINETCYFSLMISGSHHANYSDHDEDHALLSFPSRKEYASLGISIHLRFDQNSMTGDDGDQLLFQNTRAQRMWYICFRGVFNNLNYNQVPS